jgi:cytoskeletal protein CcmA (bactofilin family)
VTLSRLQRQTRGFTLFAFSMVLMLLASGFLLMLWSYQTIDLRMVNRIGNTQVAQLAAESALGLAYAELTRDRNWGKDGQAIIWEDSSNPGAFAYASFRYTGSNPDGYEPTPDEAKVFEAVGEEFQSVNNLGGQNSVFGFDGMIIPPNACVVVAVAKYRDVREVAYQIHLGSPLPYSLASEGTLTITGETVVGGLDSLESAQELSPNTISADDLSESGVVSNDDIELRGDIQVVGDVEYMNGIQQDAQVQVKGEVKKLETLVQLPEIRIADYDPKGDPSNPADDLATLVERTESVVPDAIANPFYGFHRFSGNVTFPDGLKLDGSGAFVDGNVILDGPLEGSGLLVATGSITIKGGANMKADVLAAVIAGEDLTINGQTSAGPADGSSGISSQFQGLLYSKGDLTLSNTRTIGTVVSASDAQGQPGKLVIQDSEVISTPDTSDFRLVIKSFAPQQQGGLGGALGGASTSGSGWELLEPNPADLLSEDANGNPTFVWNDSHLRIRVKQPDGSWRVISEPGEAVTNGLAVGEADSLRNAYINLKNNIWPSRVAKLNEEHKKELVDILEFDLNEFFKVSSRLKAKKSYFKI